jgi:hypothetical protein
MLHIVSTRSISEANNSVRRGVSSVRGSDKMVERVELTASEVGLTTDREDACAMKHRKTGLHDFGVCKEVP